MNLKRNLYSTKQVREIDRKAIEQYGYTGLQLMTSAGERAFSYIMKNHKNIEPLVVLCGTGNNGGDGYVVANLALTQDLDVVVVLADPPSTKDAVYVYQQFLDNGGKSLENCLEPIGRAGLIIDGLLGTGLNRVPADKYAALICAANNSAAPIVSLDIPSGLNSDTGLAYEPCISASMTITFIGQKYGLFCGEGKKFRGKVIFESLNLPDPLLSSVTPVAKLIECSERVIHKLSKNWNSHKGHFGNVIIAGGDKGMLGATLLAGRTALRVGSGLVTILSTEKHMDMPALHYPELMSQCLENQAAFALALKRADVLVLGPGLGQSDWSKNLFASLIEIERPMVVDADALTLLSQTELKRDSWVLTPHPGEAATLLGTTPSDVQDDRVNSVEAIAEKYGGICVLKGAGTLIASQGRVVRICDQGNPGMATAGMGDVLSGFIGSLMGQGLSPDEASETGVWLHSKCADEISGKIGMASLVAGDIVEAIPKILTSIN